MDSSGQDRKASSNSPRLSARSRSMRNKCDEELKWNGDGAARLNTSGVAEELMMTSIKNALIGIFQRQSQHREGWNAACDPSYDEIYGHSDGRFFKNTTIRWLTQPDFRLPRNDPAFRRESRKAR